MDIYSLDILLLELLGSFTTMSTRVHAIIDVGEMTVLPESVSHHLPKESSQDPTNLSSPILRCCPFNLPGMISLIVAMSLNPPVRLHVLSSETGNWSMHETPFGYSFRCTLLRRCIYVDGTLYCISTSKQLICFDLNRGNSRAIRLPQWKRLDPDGFGCAGSLRIVARTTALRPFALHPTSSDVIFFGTPRVMLSYHLQDRSLSQLNAWGSPQVSSKLHIKKSYLDEFPALNGQSVSYDVLQFPADGLNTPLVLLNSCS
ncbi:hypothetical protein OIU78_006102 [Salix suchowensis]|nr:hypothetical protein OIU78_006102 [Salix suchowensis]